ncbi:MAG TPA: LysM peptidoglycan-binding domain-containing protein [candidate division Zixibacteria bacterium]|nr:LysM peptidoglycan-binding domain-containing protein [candidate division Zixibacteria bacterium]
MWHYLADVRIDLEVLLVRSLTGGVLASAILLLLPVALSSHQPEQQLQHGSAVVTQAPGPTDPPSAAAPARYVIQAGDTLRDLAQRFYGDESSWERIYQANRSVIATPDHLVVGTQIVIPPPD